MSDANPATANVMSPEASCTCVPSAKETATLPPAVEINSFTTRPVVLPRTARRPVSVTPLMPDTLASPLMLSAYLPAVAKITMPRLPLATDKPVVPSPMNAVTPVAPTSTFVVRPSKLFSKV